jgi:hypothetical protein
MSSDAEGHLGLEVTMHVPKLVEFINGGKHLTNVESGLLFFENARVIE